MRSDDIAFLDNPDRKTVNFSSSPRDRIINVKAENRPSSSSGTSSGSSPSDLKRRLQDLSSSNKFTLLADRVATLGRRISHKRDHFLRLYGGVASRIEENDEWAEESEQRVESAEILSTVFRPKNARARRRVRLLLKNSQFHDDKAMVISHNNDITDSTKLIPNDKRNPIEFSANRSMEDRDYSRLSSIKVSRRQLRTTSISEPTSTRLSHQNIHDNNVTRDSNASCRSYRNYTQRDNASKPTNLPSVSPFCLSDIRLRNFGGYHAPSSVILKNLSSDSDSESTNVANRQILLSDRNIDGSSITLDVLSSPEAMVTTAVNGPIQKMPIMSARSDITRSILPNLIPSARSFCDNSADRETFQDTPRNYIPVQISRDGTGMKMSKNKLRKTIVRDGSILTIYDGITNCSRNKNVEIARGTFLKRDINPVSAKNSKEVITRLCHEFIDIESAREDALSEKGTIPHRALTSSGRDLNTEIKTGIYFARSSERSHQKGLNYCPTNQSDQDNNTTNCINKDNLDIAECGQVMNLCKKGINGTSHLIATKVHDNIIEDLSSSQNSERLESEDPSRLSGKTKILFRNETLNEDHRKAILLSVQTHQNSDIDRSHKCDQEITSITNVPILALNSQDISYSTSADSRGYSAMRSLDTRELIKALSDVSLKQATEKENDSSKYENLYCQREMISADVPTDFLTKGKTWRLPGSSVTKLSEKSLSRVPSRIPVRVFDNEIINKSTGVGSQVSDQDSSEIRNYREQILIDQNNHGYTSEMLKEANNLSDQTYKPDISLKLKNENNEVTVLQYSHANNDYRIGSLISLNLQGNPIHDKMRYQSEGYFSDKSCPSALFHETTCPADRDFSKIDDDVRSKSDHSTSRRSTETMDITSATESSRLVKYKEVSKQRNIEENVTWRTEDECVSINDEDTRDKDYCESYVEKFEEQHPSMKRRLDDTTQEITGELFPSKMRLRHHIDALSFEKTSIKQESIKNKSSLEDDSEPTKIIQSRSLISQKHREQKISDFKVRISSSTLNLSTEPKKKRRKKKNTSQERFPFTISETVDVLSIKPEDTIKCQIANNDVQVTKMDDQLEETTVHRLKVHPSLTRLATSGLENTTSEILRCAVQEHEEEKRISSSSKSRIKRFVRLFALKLRRKRQCNVNGESTKVIYENRVCQVNSRANSCSGDSSMMDGELNVDKFADKRWIVRPVVRSKPILVSDKNIPARSESLEEIRQQYSHRRYERDNLWVQGFKDTNLSDEEPENKSSPNGVENSMEQNLSEDRYMIFSADYQSIQSAQAELNVTRDNSFREPECIETPISDHAIISVAEKSKEEIDEKLDNRMDETEEDLTDCLCLNLCRLIAPSKYRLSTVEKVSSKSEKERSDPLLRKGKK